MIYVLGLLLIGVSWLLPGHYFPWTSFEQEALAAAGLGLVALAPIVAPRAWVPRVPALAIGAVALAVVPLVQFACGQFAFHSDAILSTAYLLGFALAIEAAVQLRAASDASFTLALFGAAIAASFVSTGIGLAQWLQLGPLGFIEYVGPLERVSANMRQPNQLATLLGLGIAGLLWLYEERRIHGALTSFALTFVGLCLVMTQSRTGWLFVLGFGAVWLLFREPLRLRAPVPAVALAIVAFFLLAATFGELNHWLGISETVSIGDRLQPGRRGAIWLAVLDAAWRAPWTGYGWQQIPVAQLAVAQDHVPINYWLTSGHNLLLDLAIWNGIPIALAIAGLCAWWFVRCIRTCRDVETAALLVALGVFGVHSMLELPLHYAYYLLPAGLMVGAIEGRNVAAVQSAAPRSLRIGFAAVWFGLAATLGWVASDYLRVEEDTRRAGLRDVGLMMGSEPAETPDVWLLDGPREFIRMWLSEAREGMSPAELEWMRTVSHRYPVPPALFRYALAAGLNGRGEEALKTLDLLCRASAERRCAEAKENWSKAIEKFPRLAGLAFPDDGHKGS